MKRAAVALSATLSVAGVSFAQDRDDIDMDAMRRMTTIAVGTALVVNDEAYTGVDPSFLAVPFFLYNKDDLTIAGPNVSYRFWRPAGVQLSAQTRIRFQNLDNDENDALDGLEDRKGTFEIGLRGQKRIGERLRLRAAGFVDVAGQHDGKEMELEASWELGDMRRFSFRPYAGASWQSQNIVQHYYGVRADEVILSGPNARSFFAAEEGAWVPTAGFQGYMRLSRRWQLQGRMTADFLPDEITDSPIVEDDQRLSLFIGANYFLKGPGVP